MLNTASSNQSVYQLVLSIVSNWSLTEQERLIKDISSRQVERSSSSDEHTLDIAAVSVAPAQRKYRAEEVAGTIQLRRELPVEEETGILEEALLEKYG